MEHLLDGRADQRFQVLLTPALREAAEQAARRRNISIGKLIRQSLAVAVAGELQAKPGQDGRRGA